MSFPEGEVSGPGRCTPPTIDSKVVARLDELHRRVQLAPIATITWERLFTPAERAGLGNNVFSAYEKHGGTAEMFSFVRGISFGRSIAEIASASNLASLAEAQWLTRELRRVEGPATTPGNNEDMSENVQTARAEKDLVLVTGGSVRTFYWIGDRIEVDWKRFRASWEFLWALAEQTMKGERLDYSMLGLPTERTLVSRKANLKRWCGLPEDFLEHIVDDGPGAYRLDLLRNQVVVINLGIDDWGMAPDRI